jgi:uncharacterized protein YkwD
MRRALSLLVVFTAIAASAAFLPSTAVASGKSQAASLDLGVLSQLNEIRAAHHLVPLTLSPSLSAAAAEHSRDMVARGYFAHNSSNGAPFWKRIQAFYAQGPFRYWSVGENLFWSTGSVNAAYSLKAWMASPEHRANILDPAWRQIGIAAVSSSDAPGAYHGLGVTVITTDFGVRR